MSAGSKAVKETKRKRVDIGKTLNLVGTTEELLPNTA